MYANSFITLCASLGGSRKIFGVSYADGPDIPKRSRQSVWRAAVDLSKNGSQLAVQVCYSFPTIQVALLFPLSLSVDFPLVLCI